MLLILQHVQTSPSVHAVYRYVFVYVHKFGCHRFFASPQSLMETFLNIRVIVSGDRIRSRERSVIMMNHRTRLDWMYFWSVLVRQSGVATQKIILKSALKHIPGAGGSRWGRWGETGHILGAGGSRKGGGARRDTFPGQVGQEETHSRGRWGKAGWLGRWDKKGHIPRAGESRRGGWAGGTRRDTFPGQVGQGGVVGQVGQEGTHSRGW